MMNQNVKLLAKEAGFQDGTWAPGYLAVDVRDELEHFATLIIRKCAQIAECEENNKSWNISNSIKTYFGELS